MNCNIKGILITAVGASLGLIAASTVGSTLGFFGPELQRFHNSEHIGWSEQLDGQRHEHRRAAVVLGCYRQRKPNVVGLVRSFQFGHDHRRQQLRGTFATYSGSNGLSVEVDYLLKGGSTNGQSDLSETITLTNSSTASQAYRFYQYSNYNLSQGTSDSLRARQRSTVNQTYTSMVMQTVVTPAPSEIEAALFNSTLGHLTSRPAYPLNGTASAGPGDVTLADEWTPTIAGRRQLHHQRGPAGESSFHSRTAGAGLTLRRGGSCVDDRLRLCRAPSHSVQALSSRSPEQLPLHFGQPLRRGQPVRPELLHLAVAAVVENGPVYAQPRRVGDSQSLLSVASIWNSTAQARNPAGSAGPRGG